MTKASALSDQATAELAAIKNELADLRVRFGMLQNRQVLPLADGMVAIRHTLGWIVALQEDYTFLLHFSDGVSGHERGTIDVMRAFIAPGDTVIDIGAHIGLHAIPLAYAVGEAGRVIAVEPLPRTAECLKRALICNGLFDRCEIVVGAASDINGSLSFYLGSNSMLGSLYPTVDDQMLTTVTAVRMDDHVGPDQRIDFIKLDVEGAELAALAGMEQMIARNDDIVMIAEYGSKHLERVGINPDDWFAAFAALGLSEAFVIDEASGTVAPLDRARIASMRDENILFLKPARRQAQLATVLATPASE